MAPVRAAEHVRLTQDLPELGLYRGDVGLVCSTWFDPDTAFEVECALLMPNQIQSDEKQSKN
jgi:hypothetical protein